MASIQTPPVYSVIVPCYNQGRYLPELLWSVARATRQPHEVIIVDDGSTEDATMAMLGGIAACTKRQSVTVLGKPNGGLSSARNAGMRAARGRYVQFLDADDMLFPDALDFRAAVMTRTGCDVALCNYVTCNIERTIFTRPDATIPSVDFSFAVFALGWERGVSVPIHCGLFARELAAAHPFREDLTAKEDWLFWMSLAAADTVFHSIDRPGALYRLHASSMTRDLRRMGIGWLRATALAGKLFPKFDAACMSSSLEHFSAFYLRHFWLGAGPAFPMDFYHSLLHG